MKGLLIKDLRLMLIQKRFFLMMVIIAIGMMFSMNNSSFIFGYLTFVCSLFSISSISYDEFDNGYAFLFTLPITRKEYVLEKYVFGFIVSLISWVISIIIAFSYEIIKNNMFSYIDILESAVGLLLINFIILSLLIPMKIKYGSEKGNIAQMILFGGIFIVGFMIYKAIDFFNVDLTGFIHILESLNIWVILIMILIIVFIIIFICFQTSLKIMNKKEF